MPAPSFKPDAVKILTPYVTRYRDAAKKDKAQIVQQAYLAVAALNHDKNVPGKTLHQVRRMTYARREPCLSACTTQKVKGWLGNNARSLKNNTRFIYVRPITARRVYAERLLDLGGSRHCMLNIVCQCKVSYMVLY